MCFFKQNFLEFFALLDIFKNVQFSFFEEKVLKVQIEKYVLQPDAVICIFLLKKMAEYRPSFRTYINRILTYKENYYYHNALQLEKKTKWDEARRLYNAILIINENNFEANYRMG